MENAGRRHRELLPEHHVARYCSPRTVRPDGKLSRTAFLLRPAESYLSTNWLEHFHPAARDSQIAGVVAVLSRKLDLARTGQVAVLNVGSARDLVQRRAGVSLRFVILDDAGDPSHTGIFGYSEPTQNARVATLLANSVRPDELYPARTVPNS